MVMGLKCSFCERKAIINMREHRLMLCEKHLIDFLRKRVEKTIIKYKLMTKNDNILVAVSGGKDSLGVWDILNALGYHTEGLYINLGIDKYSRISKEKVERFAASRGLTVHEVDIPKAIGTSTPMAAKAWKRSICSVCGMIKRYWMNRYAKENGFTVVVTGHNLDDEIATLFGNNTTWQIDYLQRQSIVLPETHKKLVKKVKPLAFVTEKESAAYAIARGIDYVYEECPYAKGATSIEFKYILNLLENRFPGFKLRYYNGFLKNKKIFGDSHVKLNECQVCGFPTTLDTCNYCRLKKHISQTAKSLTI